MRERPPPDVFVHKSVKNSRAARRLEETAKALYVLEETGLIRRSAPLGVSRFAADGARDWRDPEDYSWAGDPGGADPVLVAAFRGCDADGDGLVDLHDVLRWLSTAARDCDQLFLDS